MSSSGRSSLAKADDFSSVDAFLQVVCTKVSQITGVQLGAKQISMVESRLLRRTRDLGLSELSDYASYFENHEETELKALTSLLTTHHSYFFREFTHFEFLLREGLSKLIPIVRARADKTIRVWSAACSRGQEVYSLSMFLKHHLPTLAPDLKFEIFGTDIDPESVAIARNGVYTKEEVASIPLHYLGNHWAKGTGEIANYVKAKPTIKDHCQFDVANLIDLPQSVRSRQFDIIFCRNVFIYFTPEQIKGLTERFTKLLYPHGYLVIGLSESLATMGLPIHSLSPSVYQLGQKPKAVPSVSTVVPPKSAPQSPLKVLCVDDSPTVLTLLKKAFSSDPHFMLAGTATNGKEAHEFLQKNPVDVMTLDIHMPEMDGLSYLRTYFKEPHPAVVMVSSVSREDADTAVNCLRAGASDYVEKPTMQNFSDRVDEIKTKLRSAWQVRQVAPSRAELSTELTHKITLKDPEKKLRILTFGYSYRHKVKALLRDFSGTQPPTLLLVQGLKDAPEAVLAELKSTLGVTSDWVTTIPQELKANQIFLVRDLELMDSFRSRFQPTKISILSCGTPDRKVVDTLKLWKPSQILFEESSDMSKLKSSLASANTDFSPLTSFPYMSNRFLSEDA